MLNIFKTLKTEKPDKEIIALSHFFSQPKPMTTEQAFRQKTADDIRHLEDLGKKDLARLEVEKLIAHLKMEFEL